MAAHKPFFSLAHNSLASLPTKIVFDAAGWKRIAAKMEVGVGTIYRDTLEGYKTRERVF
jgi:hypothetical protein